MPKNQNAPKPSKLWIVTRDRGSKPVGRWAAVVKHGKKYLYLGPIGREWVPQNARVEGSERLFAGQLLPVENWYSDGGTYAYLFPQDWYRERAMDAHWGAIQKVVRGIHGAAPAKLTLQDMRRFLVACDVELPESAEELEEKEGGNG